MIDAVDLLHITTIRVFTLISSDSDFTGLDIRLRESGCYIYGFGERTSYRAARRRSLH